MKNLHQLTSNRALADDREDWMVAVEGIVVDNNDPENQHRVRLLIPSIDEDRIYDKWARQLVMFVGGPGYGSFFVPAEGSEVVVWGRLGQKHNLYYMSVYNENYIVPEDFRSSAVCGIRAPGDMKLMTEGDLQLEMGGGRVRTRGAFEIISPGGIFLNGKPA